MSGDGRDRDRPCVAIIDDETALVRGLSLTFEREGFRVLSAGDGEQALRLVRRERPDLVILDLMLPSVDGLDVCRRLRADDDPTVRGVPIIMLTARDDDIDKVVGLEVGADDYVTKPFNPRELVARVRAVLRRRELDRQSAEVGPETGRPAVMKSGDLVIDLAKRRVSVSGRPVSLTATEFDLLVHLAASPGRVYSREELLTSVWGYEFAGADRTVDVHVRRLREKIEPEPSSPTYVLTSWGRGYYFNDALEGGAPGRSRSARP